MILPETMPFIEAARLAHRQGKTLCISGDRVALLDRPVAGMKKLYDNERVNTDILDAYEQTERSDCCDMNEIGGFK